MAKPSIYKQLDAVQVAQGPFTMPSPRMWNPGMLKYKGRLWVSYRFHLGREHASRCATALVPLDRSTFQPTALSQHLNLMATVGDEHFEDARLFMFKGRPHISYTQMTGYKPGVDFKCVIKYARLRLLGNRWIIEETFYPKYGRNDGTAKEKNWVFFEHEGALHCVYADGPQHIVLKLDGETVVQEYTSPAAFWPWGLIRGGSAPIPYGDGKMLAIFHSSIRTEEAPHYVRYYAGAYLFEDHPPFAITDISSRPIAAGSEADGHGYDPRYSEGWKPYVVFPGGCIPDEEAWIVAFGINDWQCAIGRITSNQFQFVPPDGTKSPMRYFKIVNGSRPVQIIGIDGQTKWLKWDTPNVDRRGMMAPAGYYATKDGRESEIISEIPMIEEINSDQYRKATKKDA